MFIVGDKVDFEWSDQQMSGIIYKTYDMPYVTIVDSGGERFYVPTHQVTSAEE